MFNVPTNLEALMYKFKRTLNFKTFVCLISLSLWACGNTSGDAGVAHEETAESLSAAIEQALNDGDATKAIELIDTLNARYPKEMEWRTKTLGQRARAMERMVRDSIPLVEDKMTGTQLEIDSLMNFFEAVRQKDLPVYWVDKSLRNLGDNSVQPRLQDETNPWLLAVKVRGNKNITGLSVTDGITQVNVQPEDMAERRVKGAGVEMASFDGREMQPIVDLLQNSDASNIKMSITGTGGNTPVKLTPAMHTAIIRTSQVARLREENRLARLNRELLERKLIVAQNQIANLTK